MFLQQPPHFDSAQVQAPLGQFSPPFQSKLKKKSRKHRPSQAQLQGQNLMWNHTAPNPYQSMQPMHHFPHTYMMQPSTYFPAPFPPMGYGMPMPFTHPQAQEQVANGLQMASFNQKQASPDQGKVRQEGREKVARPLETDASDSDKSHKKPRKAKRKCLSASSKFKGVSWHKRDRCYMARVWVEGASKHIGSYQQEMRAALAVDYTLISMGKDASHLNFPDPVERDMVTSILKNQTDSQDSIKTTPSKNVVSSDSDETSSVSTSDDEMAAKGLDKNGFPNCLETILVKLLGNIQDRNKDWESKAIKAEITKTAKKDVEEAKKPNPMWDTLVEVATKQGELPNFDKTDVEEAPAGDNL